MNWFEILVIVGIFLNAFLLAWVLSHTNRMLTLINEKLFDILKVNRTINENAYSIAKNVDKAR